MLAELEERAAACGSAWHSRPLQQTAGAVAQADRRLRTGWVNEPCPHCDVFGWLTPKQVRIRRDREARLEARLAIMNRVRELADAGTTPSRMVKILNAEGITTPTGLAWGLDNLKNYLDRHKIQRRTRQNVNLPLTADQKFRIAQLTAEGMPYTWIAEDIGRSYDLVARFVAREHLNTLENILEWKRAWAVIRNDPKLAEYNREFRPKKGAVA